MRKLVLLSSLLLGVWTVGAQCYAQQDEKSVLNRYDYRLQSSKEYGLAATNKRKFNYVLTSECRLTEKQASAYSEALADSLADARPQLDELTVFLYLEGMDPAGMAFADATYKDRRFSEQNFRALAFDYTKWEEAPTCEW